jgi:hypothetical protein
MRSITLTESESDDLIHGKVSRVVAVRYADPATQFLCADGLGFFVKDPPEQVLKALSSTPLES